MKRSGHRRSERLAALLKETIADALAVKVKDPRLGFATVTDVSVTADGAQATVFVSVMGSDEEKTRAMAGLESARGFLRSHVARALSLRATPDLRFQLDRGIEHARRIDDILGQLRRDEP